MTKAGAIVAYIGLGSNLENPQQQVLRAYESMKLIPSCQCIELSPLYQSKAVGPEQPDYINAVAKLKTQLSPIQLLDQLQSIEQDQKRVRIEHWGPRTIDLDILLFGETLCNTERLTIPHPHMQNRNFVLAPLLDIEPELSMPSGQTAQAMLDRCGLDNLAPIAT